MAKRTYELKPIESNTAFEGLFCDCEELETLPLTHKKSWYAVREMLSTMTIPLEKCDVFYDENIQYFFYGRPDYVVAQGKGNRKDHLYFPVCFLIDPAYVRIDNVFPFDSGAFAEGYYDDYIVDNMDINKFQITPTIQSIKGFINYFYGNNKNYYIRKPKTIAVSYNVSDELNAYINIINANGATPFDERAEAVEIITKKPIDLLEGLRALVLPNEYEGNEGIKRIAEQLKADGVDIITYPVIGLSPEHYNYIIRSEVYKYYLSKGLYNERSLLGGDKI